MQPPQKLTPQQVFRPTSVLVWCLLTSAAGAVNAGSLLACQSFVSHITGTSTRIGVDVFRPRLMAEYGAVLISFLVGGFAAPWLMRVRTGRFSGLPFALLVVCGLLCLTSVLGHRGTFGGFGTGVETTGDFVLLVILSLAMGVQNAATSLFTRNQVRTTHMTGTATDLALSASLFVRPEADSPTRPELLRGGALRAANIGTFILGAVGAVELAPRGYALFLAPAGLLVASSLISAFAMRDDVARAPERGALSGRREAVEPEYS